MVGVPRSQGCQECRKRKKGCDLKKPRCGRCSRIGVRCSYGGKQWTFVEQKASSEGPTSEIVIRGQRTSSFPLQATTPPTSIATGTAERHLRRTGFEVETLADFWERFLPREDPETVYVGGVYPTPWSKTFLELSDSDESVKLALQACALVLRSRATSDPHFRHMAIKLYAEALGRTNKALQAPETAQSDSVLAACRALANYELLRGNKSERISSQAADWLKHIEGTCRIVQLRGPNRHVSDHGHALFEDCRTNAVLAGIIMRKPNFFTNLEWHNIPWEQTPRHLRDELFDVMITLPDLLEKNDQLLEIIEDATSMRDRYDALVRARDHISRCLQIADFLQQWEQRALAACLSEAAEMYEDEVGPIDLYTVCNNHGFGFFHMSVQYWSACILVWASTWIAYRKVRQALQPDHPPSLPAWVKPPQVPAWMNPTIPASHIVKTAAKYFTPDAGYWGSQMASWPLGITMHYYASIGMVDSQEMDHLRSLIHIPKVGQMAGQWLRSMANLNSRAKFDPGNRPVYEEIASAWFGTDKLGQRTSVAEED